jgi:hypothetical protein|eukprot:COSAG01_NODE_4872_length_4663_cov_3.540973_2_plen_63_part_00
MLYFTRCFVCLFVGLHPVHMIAAFSRSTFSPAPGAYALPSREPAAGRAAGLDVRACVRACTL